jgi:hypothetical protein
LTKLTPDKSNTAGADNRFAITVSPLTVNDDVAFTRSPTRKCEIAALNAPALPTATTRDDLNRNDPREYAIARRYRDVAGATTRAIP